MFGQIQQQLIGAGSGQQAEPKRSPIDVTSWQGDGGEPSEGSEAR
jgi:hypothetical protein